MIADLEIDRASGVYAGELFPSPDDPVDGVEFTRGWLSAQLDPALRFTALLADYQRLLGAHVDADPRPVPFIVFLPDPAWA